MEPFCTGPNRAIIWHWLSVYTVTLTYDFPHWSFRAPHPLQARGTVTLVTLNPAHLAGHWRGQSPTAEEMSAIEDESSSFFISYSSQSNALIPKLPL